ncbi:hypothetical protein SPACI_007470 [Sporomusa acidovorans DSM 3132]|uniref:PPC domain-containing protein n=1 Tax=Sporomusa acidovorans (strain ATCC 49682 / DSM 3132 / Mol) TaxID=1123286 RepID=A0ABZ3IXF1_SPOA4|nr:PPC domain-containing DNA-binding protein [Sporomusa acidovorans]OZC22351.1 hypothetical protein SPACI_14000 [Sporomusa acidovorans DSM 3132]SDE46439.1 protein of unknown function [Sporomusa acidovorans]
MEYARFGSKIAMRLDKGEEIVAAVKQFCEQQNIGLASVAAIGAVNKVSVGIFMQDTKEYHPQEFSGRWKSSVCWVQLPKKTVRFIRICISA